MFLKWSDLPCFW